MDLAAQNASLDNDYGTTHGPNSPASFLLALFVGDPLAGGVEVSNLSEVDVLDDDGNITGTEIVSNGYARAAVAHADFAPADEGIKATTNPVAFANALAEWPDTVTHWQLYATDGTTAWDSGAIADPLLDITAEGPGPTVALSIFYADAVSAPA